MNSLHRRADGRLRVPRDRARDRDPRRDGRRGRRLDRLRARRPLRRPRSRPALPPPSALASPDGAQAAAAATGARRAGARLRRVRRGRVVDLLRARDRRAPRARADAGRPRRRRRDLPRRHGVVRRGDDRDRGTGGAATFVRVAFNDLAGFLTGWALFLDYLIVIALSALFFPHYLGLAIGVHSIARAPGRRDRRLRRHRGDRARAARSRRTRLYSFSLVVPLLDLVTQLLLVRARLRLPLLAECAHARARPRDAAVVAPARVRAAARLPRVHGARDRREPRGGDPAAGTRPAAQPLPRDRRRRPRHGADRARRALGLPGAERRRPRSGRRGNARR